MTWVKQFKSVFTTEQNSDIPTVKQHITHPLEGICVRPAGVAKLLGNIKPSKSSGPDNIPNMVLQTCADNIAPGLAAIFQASLDTGTLPPDWLNANVACVFKKGDRCLPENYRPISLTSVCSKLLEHIVCRHLMSHLERNEILTNLNHGFRSGYSCETQLVVTLQDLLVSYDTNKQIDMAILDFSKAFDTVPHNKLLYKLEQYGITGNLHSWLTGFLTQRNMRVVLEGVSSDEVHVDSGVPQGTVLGPLLFLVHINDLPLRVRSQVRLFADDCLLYREITDQNDHSILQDDLQELEQWARDWGMRFNAKKCYILSIKRKSHWTYTLDSTILQNVASHPYLGIQISNDLKWKTHIAHITKKANSTLGFLRRNLRSFPLACKKNAYVSLVRSTLEYGAPVWDPYLISDIDRLERIQHRAARFITGDYRSRDPGCVTQMLSDLEIPSLQARRKMLRLVLLYKIAGGHLPSIPPGDYLNRQPHRRPVRPKRFKDHITTNIMSNSVTNNSKCFTVPPFKTDLLKNSFFHRTIIDWNHLSEDHACADSVEAFRSSLAVNLLD